MRTSRATELGCRRAAAGWRSREVSLVAASLVALLAASTSALSATSYVMTTDRELVERAVVVVAGRVTSVEPAPGNDRIATDYLVEVDRLIRGFVPGSTIVVRLPGGVRADDIGMRVLGLPELRDGDRWLLFLSAPKAGVFGVVDYALGAFREVTLGGARLAIRDLGGAQDFALPGDTHRAERLRSHLPRDFERFVDWLTDLDSTPDYFITSPRLLAAASAFRVARSGNNACGGAGGNPLRWPRFDENGAVGFNVHVDGQKGVPGGGFDEIQQALQAWNRDPGSKIDLRVDGTTVNTRAGGVPDGENVMVFEDPRGEIPGSFDPSTGGTVAIGIVFFSCQLRDFANGVAHVIGETGIVTQDGTGENFFGRAANPALTFAEVITHESGHSLGLSHSCGDDASGPCSGAIDDAIMRAIVHNDGRGARLGTDDRAAVAFLYPETAEPEPEPKAPKAATDLTARAASTSEIQLDWQDRSNNETGFEVEEQMFSTTWRKIATVAAGSVSARVVNVPEASYRAYRIRAINKAGVSAYTNEAAATTLAAAGPCLATATTHCLNRDRFETRIRFRTAQQPDGRCMALELSDDTGYCWFFDPSNVELVVKALDGCAVNGNYWVFVGGLTNVELELTVIDKATGLTKTYGNPAATPIRPTLDTAAFASCP